MPDSIFGWPPAEAVDFSVRIDPDLTVGPEGLNFGYSEIQIAPGVDEAKQAHLDYGAPTMSANVGYGSPATGGQDDIDSFYSGKSGPNPTDWKSKGEVVKTYHGGVRPDHMMFESIADEKAIEQAPMICCPNCQTKVKDLDGAKEMYPLPEGVTGIEPIAKMLYTLRPCGCKVSQEWAGAFRQELNSRKAGNDPHPVVDLTPQQRQSKINKLQATLVDLYSKRDKASSKEAMDQADYLLLVHVDQLMRLTPGAHNQLPSMPGVSKEITKWADTQGMKTPPAAIKDKYEFPNAWDDPILKKISAKLPLSPEETLKALKEKKIVPEAAKQIMAEDFDYPSGYKMPDLQAAAKKQLEASEPKGKMFTIKVPKGMSKVTAEDAVKDGIKPELAGFAADMVNALVSSVLKKSDQESFTKEIWAGYDQAGAGNSYLGLTEWPLSSQTMTEWWQQTFKVTACMASAMDAGYAVATRLMQRSITERECLLDYMLKEKPELVKMARSCLAQMVSGAVTGSKTTPQSMAPIMTREKLKLVAEQVRFSLKKHGSFCVQLINTVIKPGCGLQGAQSIMHQIDHDLEKHLNHGGPLWSETTKFLEEFIKATQGTTHPKKSSTPGAQPPGANTIVVSEPVTAADVSAYVEEQNKKIAEEHTDQFHKQFGRVKRKVRIIKDPKN